MDFENEIRERLTAVEQSVKSAHRRLDTQDKLIESVRSLTGQVIALAGEVKSLREELNSLMHKVDETENIPANRYNMIIKAIITAMAGAFAGYITGSFGR